MGMGVAFLVAVVVLDVLVVVDVLKSSFGQTFKVLMVLLVVMAPVFGVFVYYLCKFFAKRTPREFALRGKRE